MMINRGVLLAFLASAAFSMKAIFVKLAYLYGVDAVTLLALRMAFALPVLMAAAWWSGRAAPTRLTRKDWLSLLFLGIVGYYLSSILDFMGLQYITAGLERLILFLYPTVVVILSVLLFGHAIGKRTLIAMAISYVGIGIAFLHDVRFTGNQSDIVIGGSLVFLCMITYAIYLVANGQLVGRLGAIRLAAWASIVSAMACLIHFLAVDPVASAFQQPWQVYAYAGAMAGISTVLPVFLTAKAIQLVGASKVSIVGSIGPVATIFFGWLFLNETISLEQMVGAAFVLGGVMLVSSAKA
ncbi:MAG: DMT family transporter [Rhodospirillaceae bacterium]|nr:MAG: DMT family transporter [Rhodospirillaceae bacterium]